MTRRAHADYHSGMPNGLSLLIVFLTVVLPALSWAIGKMRDQMELKRKRDEWLRQREEALRTGRPVEGEEGAAAPATASRASEVEARQRQLQELAARRQEQIRKIQEQQRQRSTAVRTQGSSPSGSPAQGAPPTPRPATPRPARPGQRPQPGVPYSPSNRPARQGPPTPRAVQQPPVPEPGAAPKRQLDARGKAETQEKMHELKRRQLVLAEERRKRLGMGRLSRGRTQTESRQRKSLGVLGELNHKELRRAIVLSEVLAPPLSLREEQ